MSDRSVSHSKTLSDLERRDARGIIFPTDFIYVRSILRVGRGMFLGGQHRPIPRGGAPALPIFSWISVHTPTLFDLER